MSRNPEPVLTVAQMREAEARVAPDTDSLYGLMERAGAAVAETVWRISAGAEIVVACGPGNNGGDGYVAARILRERGANVRLSAYYPPQSELALRAAATWNGQVEVIDDDSDEAPILVDAVFGTGMARRFEGCEADTLALFGRNARRVISVDLPSGLDADSGFFNVYAATQTIQPHITLALGALKCAHVLPGAVNNCGEVHLLDIGLDLPSWPVRTIGRPVLPVIANDIHKYSRGMVAVVAGEMQGAANLAAMAAAHAGAGYVEILGGNGTSALQSIVHRPLTEDFLNDERIGAVVIGPGLGRGAEAKRWVDYLVYETRRALVIDADALHLVDLAALADRYSAAILTPHAGELLAMRKKAGLTHPDVPNVIESMRADYRDLGLGGSSVLVHKGPTTYISSRDQLRFSPRGNPWLSTAGTGDVLSGAIAAMLALYVSRGRSPLEAAEAGAWLHREAAWRLGKCFVADELALSLSAARAAL